MDSSFKKILISTEAKYKNGVPHILITGIDCRTKCSSDKIDFDLKIVRNREDIYHDVIGFYYTSQYTNINDFNIRMAQWVKYLGKSLICIIETNDSLKGWIFEEKESKISMTEINVNTTNDVNYDIWFDSNLNFWNPTDFLMDGENLDLNDSNTINTDEIILAIQDVQKVQSDMVCGFNTLIDTVQSLIRTITKNNK